VAVSGSGPGELGTAVGASRLGGLSRLLALVAEQVAKGRELASIAAVLPAAGLGPALHDTNVATLLGNDATRGHDSRDLVHHSRFLAHGHWRWSCTVVGVSRVDGRVLHGHAVSGLNRLVRVLELVLVGQRRAVRRNVWRGCQ
jgi:hypothetical protein